MSDHDAVAIEQFTKQAVPFAALHTARSDADLLQLIVGAAAVGPKSDVLDVACGPGLVALALAESAHRVTGLDLTPAMLDKARELQRRAAWDNLTWQVGRAELSLTPTALSTPLLRGFRFTI